MIQNLSQLMTVLIPTQYILNVAPEVNYCIIAALATVFDDLRTDEGC